LKIEIISNHHVNIEFGVPATYANYAELGFEDKRGGRPRKAWIELRELSDGKPKYMFSRRAREIRSLLKRYFELDSDPLIFKRRLGYSARFELRRSPSFDSLRINFAPRHELLFLAYSMT
jgi:hypothetical protein